VARDMEREAYARSRPHAARCYAGEAGYRWRSRSVSSSRIAPASLLGSSGATFFGPLKLQSKAVTVTTTTCTGQGADR
jgi:hypothetical protein